MAREQKENKGGGEGDQGNKGDPPPVMTNVVRLESMMGSSACAESTTCRQLVMRRGCHRTTGDEMSGGGRG